MDEFKRYCSDDGISHWDGIGYLIKEYVTERMARETGPTEMFG